MSCATFPIPKEYIPDEKVVYLTQNTQFGPIAYKAEAADPYEFAADLTPVNPEKPTFLRSTSWESLLRADFRADSRLYREVEAHFLRILSLPAIGELRSKLDAAEVLPTPALPPDRGEKIKDYSNGAVYAYPGFPQAQITVLDGGYYEILFADKGYFRHQADGSYERVDGKGKVLFASKPQTGYVVSPMEGFLYTVSASHKEVQGPSGALVFVGAPEPQYQFTPNEPDAPEYTLFLDGDRSVKAVALHLKNGLRFDYFSKPTVEQSKGVLVTNGNQSVFIDETFEKVHQRFDTVKKQSTDVLSIYLPEGIRLTNFVGGDPAFGEVRAAWPENYKSKTVGPFEVLYTAKDEALVGKLRADRMAALEATDRKLTGLTAQPKRTLVIPPDLNSYRKLLASRPGEVLNWYPSGFQTKDIVVMWPISVARYRAAAGQQYFFDQEFYQILTHEYVHVLVGENVGIGSPSPVWLNEGLAVYIESKTSPEVKAYWDVTFEVSRGLKRLLDWDLVTTTGTGELPIAKARVHYAQSYALVSALYQKFGAAKVAAYIKSFRVSPEDYAKVDLKTAYKTRFKAVFGMDFAQALKLLDPPQAPQK